MKVTIHTDAGDFGPINAGVIRTFWGYGLIPRGTMVSLAKQTTRVPIEDSSELNAFAKRLAEDAAYFNGATLLSQRAPVTIRQRDYLRHLGWPFTIQRLNYYQVDVLRKRLEESFPKLRGPFIDPENPWSPGSTSPLNLTDEERSQREYLEFLGIEFSEVISAEDAADLITKYGSPEKLRSWKDAPNAWKHLPPTNRQLKVLRFFGCQIPPSTDRGMANVVISRIFSEDANCERWEKYKMLTGDLGDDSPDLIPFDLSRLEAIEITPELNEEQRGRRKEIWEFLTTAEKYWFTWIKMADLDGILKAADLQDFVDADQFDELNRRVLEFLPMYSSELAEKERRARR